MSATGCIAVADVHSSGDIRKIPPPKGLCFRGGTHIRTDKGEAPIETLQLGDLVMTISGATRPVRRIAQRSYSGQFAAGNPEVLPVLICSGALGDAVPRRDLWVSPAHGLFLDGLLIPARALVNGVSIRQVEAVDEVSYFRLELDKHDVIYAENAPAESFFDEEIESGCASRAPEGEAVEAVRRRLAGRSSSVPTRCEGSLIREALPAPWRGSLDSATRQRIEGWAWDERTPQVPVALLILDNGEVVARVLANRYREDLKNAGVGDGRHAFSALIPGGLSPLMRHVIQVLGEADGCEMPGSPVTIPVSTSFDDALKHAFSSALAALALPAERERALAFLAAQTERLLQDMADADMGREARLIQLQFERRWGKAEGCGAPHSSRAPRPRALVIDDLVPALDRDAGSAAILSHMRALQSLGYDVSFIAAEEMSPHASASAQLEAHDIACCRTPYYVSVEEVLRRQRDGFELIYLHRMSNAANYLALARRYFPKARIVYSVADLHHVRVARQAALQGRPELMAYSHRLRVTESMAASSANAVITHSSFEATVLRQAVAGCNVHVVPWAVPVRPTTRPWSERQGIAFIANFGHLPNLDAAHFLAEQIMPRVRSESSSIECLLIGSRMPDSIKRLGVPGIVVVGHVRDLGPIYERVRLIVAPLRYGAGVKGKVLESLAAGVPCVMTPVAAEGIALPDSMKITIGSDAAQLAATILRLYAHEAECRALAQAGLAFIAAGYGEEAVTAGLREAIEGRITRAAPRELPPTI